MEDNMSKQMKGIVIVLVIVGLVLGVSIYMGKDDLALRTQLNNDAVFEIFDQGNALATYTMEEIEALGASEFKAHLKSSGQAAVEYTYQGVLMKTILEDAGVDFEGKDSAIVTAVDGYAVSVGMDKLMDDDNVYLAYMREGELLGTYEDGGRGPYMMIIRKDQFSQYWCKYAYRVELQ